MKDIRLKSISIENFRGIKSFEFNAGNKYTEIAGDNATGKTTIESAFNWCIYGKDQMDRKDYEILPSVDGVPMRLTASVEILFSVNGEDVKLKRCYAQKWVMPKDSSSEVFKGNETTCYWNEYPVIVTEYSKRVKELIDDSLFKMLTNPLHFCNLNWKVQREMLFQMMPAITDEDVAKRDKRFLDLLEYLNGASMEDYNKKISHELTQLKLDFDKIQPKIEENQRNIKDLGDVSKADLERELNRIDDKIADLENQMASPLAKIKAVADKNIEIQKDIELKNQMILDQKNKWRDAQNEIIDSFNNGVRNKMNAIRDEEANLDKLKSDLKKINDEISNLENKLKVSDSEIEKKTNEYFKIEDTEYDGSDICPTCGQKLPDDMIDQAKNNFNLNKAEKLKKIVAEGNKLRSDNEELKMKIEVGKSNIASLTDTIENLKMNIADMKMEELQMKPRVTFADFPKSDDVDKLQCEIEKLKNSFANADDQNDANESIKASLNEQKNIRDEVKSKIKNFEDNEKLSNRIEELSNDKIEISQRIADIKKDIKTIQDFGFAKVDALEENINSLFKSVKWKLTRYTLDGNREDVCIAIIGDALFPVANSAAQINAGLEIINAIAKNNGVRCPIFIDNAEGITKINNNDMQLICMYVVKDKELQVVDQY